MAKKHHPIRNHVMMFLCEGGELSSGESKVENIHNIYDGKHQSVFQIHWILTGTLLNQNNQMRVCLFTICHLQSRHREYT